MKQQSNLYQENVEPMGFSLPLYLSFLFHFDQLNYVNKNDVSASRNSSQNAAIQENLKTNEVSERTH